MSFKTTNNNVEVEFSESHFSLDQKGMTDIIVKIRQNGGDPAESELTITATSSVPGEKNSASHAFRLKTEETGLKSLMKIQYIVVLTIMIIIVIVLFFVWRGSGKKE